ncbi:MAG: hypothetical protein AB2L11_07180 [Syntrophobacteraceae bacterium]
MSFLKIRKIDANRSPGLKGLVTHHVSDSLYKALALDISVDPYEILLRLSEWLETHVTKVNEAMRPHLCTGENAKLLGLPDGSPLFHLEYFVRDKNGLRHFLEFISTANIHSRKMQLN